MALSPQMEQAWLSDEAERKYKTIQIRQRIIDRFKTAMTWQSRLEETKRLQSDAYARPIKFIPRVRKPVKLMVIESLKLLIP